MAVTVLRDSTIPRPPDFAVSELGSIDSRLRFRFIPCHDPEAHGVCERSKISLEPLCGHWVLERRVEPWQWGPDWEWERPDYIIDYVISGPDGGYAPITGEFIARLRAAYTKDLGEWKRAVREAVRRRREQAERAIEERIEDFGNFLAFVYTPKIFTGG